MEHVDVSPCEEADVHGSRRHAGPAFGNMLLEQFGGANGELAAAMQYSDPGPQLRRPRAQGSADGHRHRRAEPPRDRRHARPPAPQADEVRSRRRRGRSADRDCRRRRRQSVQLAGQPLDGGLPEDHRRARRRSAQQHRRRGAREDRLRAAASTSPTMPAPRTRCSS